jgi:hypothetical protein
MSKISQEQLDRIAQLEVDAIELGLQDPELRLSPQFLATARKFLKENNLITQPDTPGVKKIVQDAVPLFDQMGTEVN